MDQIYRENILDHFKHPRNFGKLNKPSIAATDNLVSCGDSLNLELLFDEKTQKVVDVAWQGKGCAISMASISLLSEKIKDETVYVLRKYNKEDILNLLGVQLTPTRLKCALLSLEVLHKAINI